MLRIRDLPVHYDEVYAAHSQRSGLRTGMGYFLQDTVIVLKQFLWWSESGDKGVTHLMGSIPKVMFLEVMS